ncbi:hypothetical protein RD792_008907 [Penstemon davidsonii]|uniref:Cytochrome P450 n=1 Tax=Penstemon davidsonii TaxID=160366 RepID=A0ABR0DAI4_9LAMI|nr:hypothetical protein RD792_008907 [Penstemon davidsonii]
MDVMVAVMVVLFLFVLAWFYVFRSNNSSSKRLPPGPYPFPIIGNLLQMGGKYPHVTLAKFSKTYGPLMSFRLGSVYTVIVTNTEMTKEIMLKNDLAFSGRANVTAAKAHDHHINSVAFLPVGHQWNKIRRLCREQIFSTRHLEASQGLRQEKLKQMFDYVTECSLSGRVVNIGKVVFTTTLNLTSVTLFSEDFGTYTDSTTEWEQVIRGALDLVGAPNFADFFPILKLVDPQGIKRKADKCFGRLLEMFEDIINQRLEYSKNNPTKKKDLLQLLLDDENDYNLSLFDLKHLLLDLIVAGADPTTSTIEWIMTELLLNPEIMSKIRDELKGVVGENKQIKESDILGLPYLEAVIKEIFRLHPPNPLLNRTSNADTEINGYRIPKNTQVLFNAWAMGRDPNVWPDPDSIKPERFLHSKIDFKGQNFELLPFGSGRRICPGLPLADRMVPLVLAYLIHNFDWEIKSDTSTGDKFGISVHRAAPLMALPIKAT